MQHGSHNPNSKVSLLNRVTNILVSECVAATLEVYEILTQHFLYFAVPPHQLLIYENSGRDVSTPVVGPLTEGSDLVLTCEVRGGKPYVLIDACACPFTLYVKHIV